LRRYRRYRQYRRCPLRPPGRASGLRGH
jgi:hypothetical protein